MAFLPLGDDNRTRRISLAKVTWSIIALNFFIFVYEFGLNQGALEKLIYGFGFIPGALTGEAGLSDELKQIPAWATLFSYQFLHGGWDHLIGNMLFLWIFGDNVEDAMGHWRFLVFYLLTGALAALSHLIGDSSSLSPLIGASGAISGVLGAYLLLHPFARVVMLILIFPVRVPAWFLLLVWFGFQFFALSEYQADGVAWLAHIGGFVAGLLLVGLFKQRDVPLFASKDSYVALPHRLAASQPKKAPSAGQIRRSDDEPRKPGPWG